MDINGRWIFLCWSWPHDLKQRQTTAIYTTTSFISPRNNTPNSFKQHCCQHTASPAPMWHALQTDPEPVDNALNPSAVSPPRYYQWNQHLLWNATESPGDTEERVLWSLAPRRSKWAVLNSPPPAAPRGGGEENPIIFGGRHCSNWQQLLRQQSQPKEGEACPPCRRDNRENLTCGGLIHRTNNTK